MVCCAENCLASIHADTRAEADEKARAAGWRTWLDGKVPGLGIGEALCPKHVGDAKEIE